MKNHPSNPKVHFITGGARSGKSRFALTIGESYDLKKVFLATAEPRDEEMTERIRRHREERGNGWYTIEEPVEVVSRLAEHAGPDIVIVLDCITLWISNLMMISGENHGAAEAEIKRLAGYLATCSSPVIAVSNELGMGIVPADPISRLYRDLVGLANQEIARVAGTVTLMVSGIPLFLKKLQ
jgi:adenosylcobinamide kinase / adenosylcobinamide-phosphate guanylyltransferase